MSAFDPNLFLDAAQNEVNERRPPIPEENPDSPDGLYTVVVGEIKTDSGIIEKGDRKGDPWISVIVPLKLDVPPVLRDQMKQPPTLTFTDRVFLDLTPQKTIDNAPGKNRRQREYRDALDLNKPGDVFSWRQIQGRVLKLKIKHEMYEGNIQERIGAISKA